MLCCAVQSNVRLLKLYESGLPGWAVLLPSYGLWYRPWLRRVTWLLFVVLSVVSMAMGFYDLYKNVPYFKQAIIAMFSPAAAVFEWLEHHTQVGETVTGSVCTCVASHVAVKPACHIMWFSGGNRRNARGLLKP